MNTRRTAALVGAALLALTLAGCNMTISPIGGGTGGTPKSGTFSYAGSITAIDISHMGATINVSPTRSQEVTYTADSTQIDSLDLSVKNGVLTITTKNNVILAGVKGPTFTIGAPALTSITVAGAVAINGSGTFSAGKFALTIDGTASSHLDLAVQSVTVVANGGAALTLGGTASQADITINGAGTVSARNLKAQDAKVAVNGAGTIDITATKTLDASVTGLGKVTYWGNPELTKNTAGLAQVKQGT